MNQKLEAHNSRVIVTTLNGRDKIYILETLKQTESFARTITSKIHGGDVIALSGNLGSGKTTFTQFLAHDLGVRNHVTSPTFVLMKLYQTGVEAHKRGICVMCHIDAYRLTSVDDLITIGADEYIGKNDTVTVIEWAERVTSILPRTTFFISFHHTKKTFASKS